MSDELDAVLAALDERARMEPGLERYRVAGRGARALEDVPPGWFVSDAIARIATEGGWWPGEWEFPVVDDIVALVVTGRSDPLSDADVRWLGLGHVYERDGFWTPALREPSDTAPLFGFSNQALWTSMVFPTEAAILEAFIITYDELGLDEHGEINPFFVEWVTRPPAQHEPEAAYRVHRRLMERSQQWTTDHRCWVEGAMPRVSWEPGHDDWPHELANAILGVRSTP